MEQFFEMSLLIDFYGQILTTRQYELMDLYYNNDFSLAEISQELSISRQAVHDGIKKSKTQLFEMEEKLGLVKKFEEQRVKAKEALQIISAIEGYKLEDECYCKLNDLKEIIDSILKRI